MGKITIVGSGSNGNSYILEASGHKLIIELGCKWSETLKALNHDISNVDGCIVSHRHLDHAKYIPDALRLQLPVYSCQDVAEHYTGVRVLETTNKYRIGNFFVQPISVYHNVENYAYMIDNDEIGRLLFITDCVRFPYKINKCNHLFVEANYSNEIVIDHLCDNQEIRNQNEYHMEINDTLRCVEANMNPWMNTICLLHLSDGQSDEFKFQTMVRDKFGIMPYVADKGLTIELNKEDF